MLANPAPGARPGIVPVVTTERLRLRPFTLADAIPFHALLGAPDMLKYFPTTTAPTLERVETMLGTIEKNWATHGYSMWAVELLADGTLVGRCGLSLVAESNEVEIDFIIGRPWWGRGIATEAGRAALAFGFDTLGVETIIGIVHPENVVSIRLLERLGLVRTRAANYFGMDCYRYEITRERTARP